MLVRDGQTGEAVLAALARHDERRRSGMPTVSVLVGPAAVATRLILLWAEVLVRPVALVRLQQPELQTVVAAWVDDLARKLDLRAAAIDWLARRIARTTWSLERSLRLMTPHEVGMFLESVLPQWNPRPG